MKQTFFAGIVAACALGLFAGCTSTSAVEAKSGLKSSESAPSKPMRYYGGPKSPMWQSTSDWQSISDSRPSKPMRYYGGPKSPMWQSTE